MISGYILVYSSADAFYAEEIFKTHNINIKLMPTPRELSSDCGVCIYFEIESIDKIHLVLNNKNLEYEIKLK